MKTHPLYILLLALGLSLSTIAQTKPVSAQANPMQTKKDSLLLHFRVSHTDLDTSYMGNAKALGDARRIIKEYQSPDSSLRLMEIKVVGAASPEGSIKFNEWLSHRRAERIFDYLGNQISLPDSLASFTFIGRDWVGLRRLVAADANVPYRADVLTALDEVVSNYQVGETENQHNLEKITALHGGVPYRYMLRHLFPTLRASKLMLTFSRPTPLFPLLDIDNPISWVVDSLPIDIQGVWSLPQAKKPFYMALKSNLLSDAAMIPHIGAEFYLGKNLSIVGNWWYGWWDNNRTHFWWRSYGGDLGLRWWFGKAAHEKPLTGHHIGLYGGAVTYDFELGGTGYMGGLPHRTLWDRCNFFGGVEYGYSLPITRRLNIDFTFGLGYMGGKYIVYDPKEKWYVYRETKNLHWVGPTKLEVSLTWLIGRGNYNEKKGGRK